MQKTDWVDVKKRLKKAVDQGMKVLKEGGEGARYVAGQTAHVLHLELEIHGLKARIATLMHRLGEAVYKARANGRIHADPETAKLVQDLDLLVASMKKKEAEVRRTSITRKAAGARQAPSARQAAKRK